MKRFLLLCAASALLIGCKSGHEVTISLENETEFARSGEMVSLPADSVLALLGSRYCYVTDHEGNEIPSQLTHDGQLIFRADVASGATATYTVLASDTLRSYSRLTGGRVYPERADDIAWENELVGFRAYGPATQAKGEKAFGYDIFFKHPTTDQILEALYGPETDPATWQKADSLRRIDPALADEFVNSISYHIDHGLGMDCYAVGPTLGDGVAAIVESDSLCFPWCYEKAEVLDNGPLRFTVKMQFAPVAIGSDSAVVEHRIISLDAGSHLNYCKVWYDGLSEAKRIATGFPRRDDSEAVMDKANGLIAYSDPTQGPDNGKALLGVVLPGGADSVAEASGHILAYTTVSPSDTLGYYWGFAWDKADVENMAEWNNLLSGFAAAIQRPLSVTYH